MFSTDSEDRADFITGLRQLADYLDTHRDIPVPGWASITFHADAVENGGREQVSQIADALGTGIDPYSSETHYRTGERKFGPITYGAVSISDAEMARYYALNSYRDCVTPDGESPDA